MTALENVLEKAVAECISDPGLFLVDLSIKGSAGQQKIMVFIDGDRSVGIDECAGISHKLSDMIEANDWIKENYTLEVSTPGAAKPLKYLRQYSKHAGRELEILNKRGEKVTGKLIRVDGEDIILSVEVPTGKKKQKSEEIKIGYGEIAGAKVLIRI